MKTEPAALAAAHDELTAAVRKLAARGVSGRRAAPPDHVVYRNAGRSNTSPADRHVLASIGKGLAKQVSAQGYTLHLKPIEGGAIGETNHLEKTVVIDPAIQDTRRVGTLIHELAHIRLRHFERMRRDIFSPREVMETEAESVAYIVGKALGLELMGFSAPYISNWADGDTEYLRMTKPLVLRTAAAILADL